MTRGPAPTTTSGSEATLWRLLSAGETGDAAVQLALLDAAEAALGGADDDGPAPAGGHPDPGPAAWRHALAARRLLVEGQPASVSLQVAAAREALPEHSATAGSALLLAWLAHVEVCADHMDAAMLLAVDASVHAETAAAQAGGPLYLAHRWLCLTLTGLELEELAVAHAVRAEELAAALPAPADRWQSLVLSAAAHTELAQTLHRQGRAGQARTLADAAIARATDARALPEEPEPHRELLLDVVQAWALTCRDDLDDALGPLRRARRRVQEEGDTWSRGFTDLALARLLARLSSRDGDPATGEESVQLMVDAAGAFLAAGDRRRHRGCLLELGRTAAALGRPGEALHWLEAYRAETGRAHAHGLQLWAEMFVRRSRLREAERTTALLRRHALEDPLTGLGNRRSAERRLTGLQLGEEPLSLAVVDVDRFKAVNDGGSHTSGDVVLRRVADLLREHSRGGDEVFRWAGDEFLVVLPTATQAQAVGVMERLRSAVAGADWSDLRLPEPVTVSIGVATAPAASGAPPAAGWRALFDTADLNLFSAKRSGRNRVRAPGADDPDAGGGPA